MDWASDSPTGPIRPFSWQSDLRFLSPFSASSYSACRTAAMRAWSNTRGGRSRCNKDAKAQRVRSIPLVRRKVTGSEEFLSRRHSLLSTTWAGRNCKRSSTTRASSREPKAGNSLGTKRVLDFPARASIDLGPPDNAEVLNTGDRTLSRW